MLGMSSHSYESLLLKTSFLRMPLVLHQNMGVNKQEEDVGYRPSGILEVRDVKGILRTMV